MKQERNILSVGRSAAKVRIAKRAPLPRPTDAELCILETVWERSAGPRYAVAYRHGGGMGYWKDWTREKDVFISVRWNGMDMRQFLNWQSREDAEREFGRLLSTLTR
jgi:hypothetical protein